MSKPTDKDIAAEKKLEALKSKYKAGDDVRLAVLDVAACFLGVREIGTSNKGYWIDKFHQQLGLTPGMPWCLMFVQYVFRYGSELVGMKDILSQNTASTQRLASWAEGQKLCITDIQDALPGDVIIWRDGKKEPPLGHVGIIILASKTEDGVELQTIEGNTSEAKYRDGGLVAVKNYTYKRGDLGGARDVGRWLRCIISFGKLG